MSNIDNTQDIIDVRDIIERFAELEAEREQVEGEALVAWEAESGDEFGDLAMLLADLKGNGGDEQWRGDWYPVTLVRYDHFQDYAQELVEDCENLGSVPSYVCIDWEATARNVRMDYTSTEIDGVTYWYR